MGPKEKEPKKFDPMRPWFNNPDCSFRFQLDNNLGSIVGVYVRIDTDKYREYVVVDQDGVLTHINRDHIVHVRGI